MKTRQVEVRVICDLPEGMSVKEFKEDIKWAIEEYYYFNKEITYSLQVKSPYTRRSS